MGQDRGEAVSLSQLDSPDSAQPTRREQGSRGSALDRVRGGLSSPGGGTRQSPVDEEETPSAEASAGRRSWPFFARFEWMIALRYLRARRKEGFISVIAGFSFLGILLGVATLIIVLAVMNGFRKELLDKILGLNGHLLIQPLDSPLSDWAAVADRIAKVNGVTLAAPVVVGQALASSQFDSGGVLVHGIRGQDLSRLGSIASNLRQGSLNDFDAGQGIAIGRRLADKLSVHAGDRVTLVSPRGAVTPMGTTPRIKPYNVAAVFEIGMSEYDSGIIFMALPEAQAYFNRGEAVDGIEVYTEDPDKIDRFRRLVAEAAVRPIFMVDWRQRNKTFFGALQVERNVMFLILTLIVLVAALNIVSGLIMLVKDKGRDIGILRTMGATQGAIMRIFLITGSAIGVVGTVFGLLVGVLICINIESIRQFLSLLVGSDIFPAELYFLSHLPAEMDPAETTAVVVMALTLSFLATLYPSWRAARLDPVEALRYE
jgi:lipoprotein-releasing system permease protein